MPTGPLARPGGVVAPERARATGTAGRAALHIRGASRPGRQQGPRRSRGRTRAALLVTGETLLTVGVDKDARRRQGGLHNVAPWVPCLLPHDLSAGVKHQRDGQSGAVQR